MKIFGLQLFRIAFSILILVQFQATCFGKLVHRRGAEIAKIAQRINSVPTPRSQRLCGESYYQNRANGFVLCSGRLPFTLATNVYAQKVVDQILVLVNDEIITRSDLLWSLAMDPEAPSPAGPVSSDLLRQKLEVMIDERLIAQEAARIPTAEISQEEITAKRTQLINRFKSEAMFRERVASVGLTPERLDALIRQRILIDRFVDFRFQSFVFVSEQEIQKYYDEVFAPEMRKKGQVPTPIDAELPNKIKVRDYIREILKQEKITTEIDRYLNEARQRAEIVSLAEP